MYKLQNKHGKLKKLGGYLCCNMQLQKTNLEILI